MSGSIGGWGISGTLVLKLDAKGNVQWHKTYGPEKRRGAVAVHAQSIQPTSAGGYIVAGSIALRLPAEDNLVFKLDDSGNVIWQKTYGQSGALRSIRQTSDGGYMVAGAVGGRSIDIWVLKLDNNGDVQWQKAYGGIGDDGANSIAQTADGGYVVAGYTTSFGINGTSDFWVLKLDIGGAVQWQKTYGGTGNMDGSGYAGFEQVDSIHQTSDGGYIVAGVSPSFEPGDALVQKVWLLKLRHDGSLSTTCPPGIGVDSKATVTPTNATATAITEIKMIPDAEIETTLRGEKVTVTSPNVTSSDTKAQVRTQC